MRSGRDLVVKNRATEESRDRRPSRFPFEKILKRGCDLATICYGNIDPDFHDGFQQSIINNQLKIVD